MESLASLKTELSNAKSELSSITIRKHGDVKWAPGDYDGRTGGPSYSYNEYTDPGRARILLAEIKKLEKEIETYPQRAAAERREKEAEEERRRNKYEYTSAGKVERTSNPAIAARYSAQQRLFGKNKVMQALYTITGQKRKFKKLWNQAGDFNKNQEEIAGKLDKMFR